MSIKDNINRIKNIINKKIFQKEEDEEKEIVKLLAESYKEKKKNGAEHPIDSTVEQAMDIINNSPNPELAAEKILKATFETEEIPDRISEKVSVMISKSDNIDDKVITNAVVKSDRDIPDESINTIIKEGDIDLTQRLKLIRNVEDQEIIADRIKNEFHILYRVCKDKRDDEIVARIEELKQIVLQNEVDMDMQGMIEEIIAKRMAENIYNDKKRGTRIYTLSQVFPPEKMLENDLPSKVQEKYKQIEEERDAKEGRFNLESLRAQILKEIGKNVGYKYKRNKAFIIPQSENMKNINMQEELLLINTIETASGKVLEDAEKKEIAEEIRGIINNKETREQMLLDDIRNMNDKDKNINLVSSIVRDEQKLKTLEMMEQNGLIEELKKISSLETREKTIQAIGDTLRSRRQQIAIAQKENEKEISTENSLEER